VASEQLTLIALITLACWHAHRRLAPIAWKPDEHRIAVVSPLLTKIRGILGTARQAAASVRTWRIALPRRRSQSASICEICAICVRCS